MKNKYPTLVKECVTCQKSFTTKKTRQINCGKKCSRLYKNKRQRERKQTAKGKELARAWRHKNIHKVRQSQREKYHENMKDENFANKLRKRNREYMREYSSRPEVKEKQRKYQRARLNTPMGKLNNRIRSGVRQSLRGNKSQNTYDALGYTKDDLVLHLESQFTDGMSWDNISEWHIDHIRPISSFKFTTEDCEDLRKCWALNNLQPLWAADNISKGNKWDGEVNA